VRALQFAAPNRLAVLDVPAPAPDEGGALIAPAFVGLCGTDLELFSGSMPYLEQGDGQVLEEIAARRNRSAPKILLRVDSKQESPSGGLGADEIDSNDVVRSEKGLGYQ
jgi:hypothetical protein